jgi:hypothetical protein
MSWLSALFDTGPTSDEINAQAAAQQAQLQAQAAADAEQKRQFDVLNTPSDYDKMLQEQQTAALQREQELGTLRSGALSSLGGTFAPEFERSLIPSTYDDPFIASAYASERGKADEYLNNLLKRGVITQAGYTGGQQAVGEQEAGVRSQLQTLGDQLLEAQRGKLTDVANRARGTASTLELGQTFDPNIYSNELNTTVGDIGSQFGDLYSASAPKGLFDLSGLASKAGAAQGAQNLAFDPEALAGTIPPSEDATANPLTTPKRATSVF